MNASSARIGYARVSTADQNLAAQIAALKKAGGTMIRTETGDGATPARRPELGAILDFIHPGETLVVTRIDRLARSMRDLQIIVATLKDKGAHLAATEQPVDTSTAAGKALFDMLGVFAEFEINLRRERQTEGVAAAEQRGAYRGRPPRIDMEAIKHRLAPSLSPTQIAASSESPAGPSTRPRPTCQTAREEVDRVRFRATQRRHRPRGATPSASVGPRFKMSIFGNCSPDLGSRMENS